MGTIRVLIVDDSPFIRASLRSILQAHADVEVVADVGDGPAAVSTAGEKTTGCGPHGRPDAWNERR